MTSKKPYSGGCHCGFIRYTVNLDLSTPTATKCNCTICLKSGYMAIRVNPADFTLTSPASESELADYQYGSNAMHHYFCRTCGIKCITRGTFEFEGKEVKSFTLNLLTLDQGQGIDWTAFKVKYWDGLRENWALGLSDKPYPGGAW